MEINEVIFNHKILRGCRKSKKLSQQEVGQMIGISGAGVSVIEKGGKKPSADVLVRLCALYGIGIESLTATREAA